MQGDRAAGPMTGTVVDLSDLPANAGLSVLSASRAFVVGPDASPAAVRALLAYAAGDGFADRSIVFFGGAGEAIEIPPAAAARCNFIRTGSSRPEALRIAEMLVTDRDSPALLPPSRCCDFNGQFRLRTLDDVERCARLISDLLLFEITTSLGFRELALNAVEHGNLGISHAEKSELLRCGDWYAEVLRRLALPEYRDRYATVDIAFGATGGEIRIVDQGAGFDWVRYIDGARSGPGSHHGRGISMAMAGEDFTVRYSGRGNDVRMTFPGDARS